MTVPKADDFHLLIVVPINRKIRVDRPEDLPNEPYSIIDTNYDRTDLRSFSEVAWDEDKADGILDSKDPWP
jgi:hypothetical protein